jgi:DNA-binding transcriptional LysR family regulator
MDEIDLRLFRYFIAVAEELHFGHAAERVGIAQPPLSQQIRRLEQKLGAELLHRTKRRVELTEAGKVFLEQARLTISQAELAISMTRRAARGEVGRLAVGMISSASYEDVIPRAIRVFRERYPDAELVLQECSTAHQVDLLHRHEIQIGFVRPPVVDPALTILTVKREPLVAALPKSHKLAGRAEIRVGDLASERWIMLPRNSGLGFYDLVLEVCRKAGFSPVVAQEATQIHTMTGLVAAGLGVALVPAAVQNLRRPGVVYRRLAGHTPAAELAAAYLKSGRPPVLDAFLAVLRKIAAS